VQRTLSSLPFFHRAVLILLFEHNSLHSFNYVHILPVIMKTVYPLLTLLSASMVAAAPAPFVVSGDVAAIGSATTSLGSRDVQDFGKRAPQLRSALVAARSQKNAEDAATADDQAQQQQDTGAGAADEEQAKGKGKGKKDAQAGKFNDTITAVRY
jgi:hypothetical protein